MKSGNLSKQWLYASLMAVLAVVCGLPLWWASVSYKLTLTYHSTKFSKCQIYYAPEGERFSANRSQMIECQPGKGEISTIIPAEDLHRLRIDFGSSPGKVTLSNVRLKGQNRINLLLVGDFTPKNIETCEETDSQLTFHATHKDPQLIYNQPIPQIAGEGRLRISHNWLIGLAAGGIYLYFAGCYVYSLLVKRPTSGTATQKPKKGKLNNIEFLRLYFTFAVMMLHFCTQFGIWTSGSQGVEFFFILSGYLMALTYKPERTLLEYAQQRYIRFVPLIVIGGLLAGGSWSSFEDIFLLQSTGLAYKVSANTPAWYIAVLFWCSLFYLGLMKRIKSQHLVYILGIVAFILCLAIVNTPGRHGMFADLLTKRMMRGLGCMAIGIMLAHFCRPDSAEPSEQRTSRATLYYSIAEFGILFYIFGSLMSKNIFIEYWIFQPISHIILIWLFIRKRGIFSRLLDRNIFSVMAKYCLAIYLTHSAFYRTVQTFVKLNFPGWLESHAELAITLAIVGSCILGVIAYYLVELPCAHFLGSLLKKKATVQKES